MSREKFKELVDEGKEWPNRGQKMVEDRRTAIAWASRRIEKLEKVREAATIAQKWMENNVALGQATYDSGPEPISMFDNELNNMAGMLCQALRDAEEE